MIEAGLKRAKSDFRFDTSVYYTNFDGFIFRQLTDASNWRNIGWLGSSGRLVIPALPRA